MSGTRPSADGDITGSVTRQHATVGRVNASPPIIDAMTGIRAVAAAWVVVGHIWSSLAALVPAAHALDRVFFYGYLGVDIFFVLSGFIISYNYAERLAVLDRSSYGRFMMARFARIYPVHLATFLMVATLVAWVASLGSTLNPVQHYTATGAVGNLLMLQALPGVEAWNIPAWSICCEMAAYVAFPFLAGFLVARGRKAALGLGAAITGIQLGAIGLLVATGTFLPIPLYWIRIAGEFTLGCLLWVVWRHGLRPRRLWDGAAVASLLATGLILALGPSIALSMVTVPFLASFVLATACSAGPVKAVLSSRPVEWGGRISYSLYLVHFPVLLVLFLLLSFERFAGASLPVRAGVAAVYVLLPVIAAASTYYLIEGPARRWLRRLRDRRPATIAAPARQAADQVTTPDRPAAVR